MYRASIGITTGMEQSATNWIGLNADSLGVEGIWVGEDIGVGQEISILTTSLLENAKSARVGTGIIPIVAYNISTIARMALTLHEIGNERFILGIGVGGIQDIARLNLQLKKPVSTLRDATLSLRQLFRTESVTTDSELFNLKEYSLRIKDSVKIPIFFGVRGPQMLKLAGEIADGVILSGPLEYIRYAIDTLDKAALKSKRSPEDIEKVVWSPTIPTFKGGSEKLAKRIVALVVADTPSQVLELLDIDREKANRIREAVGVSGPKAGADLIDQQFIDTFAISGTKEHMVDRFDVLNKMGATEVVLGPPFSGDWREAVTDIFHEIDIRRTTK